jgi:glycosyltransferase involved in cell wall biosynthesis
MRLIINTAHQRFGGAVQVALSFINECIAFKEHEYHVFLGPGVAKSLDKDKFPTNFYFYDFDFGVIDFKAIKQIQRVLRKLEHTIKPEILFSSTGPTYYHSIAPQVIGFNLPLYIYPESPFVRDLSFTQKLKLWFKKQLHFYYFKRDAVAYVVQTDDVNARVRIALGTKKVFTVTNNHSAYYLDESLTFPSKLPPRFDGEFRFLTLTSYYGHKNLEIIPKISKLLKDNGIHNVRFVLTIKPEEAKNHGLTEGSIINVGPIKPFECPQLYRDCDAMFLPTLAECFSASYPEAMIMEKPIITTDLGFARGTCGNAALYFEPKNHHAAFEKILELINNDILYKQLVASGKKELNKFDAPRDRAAKYLEICEQFKSK